jgi:hypothetical protein
MQYDYSRSSLTYGQHNVKLLLLFNLLTDVTSYYVTVAPSVGELLLVE